MIRSEDKDGDDEDGRWKMEDDGDGHGPPHGCSIEVCLAHPLAYLQKVSLSLRDLYRNCKLCNRPSI